MSWALHFPLTLLLYINIIQRAPCGVWFVYYQQCSQLQNEKILKICPFLRLSYIIISLAVAAAVDGKFDVTGRTEDITPLYAHHRTRRRLSYLLLPLPQGKLKKNKRKGVQWQMSTDARLGSMMSERGVMKVCNPHRKKRKVGRKNNKQSLK